jgi:hypothetical protein
VNALGPLRTDLNNKELGSFIMNNIPMLFVRRVEANTSH